MDRQELFGHEVDLDAISAEHLRSYRQICINRQAEYAGYIATLNFKLLQRDMNPLPFEDEDLGAYAEVADSIICLGEKPAGRVV